MTQAENALSVSSAQNHLLIDIRYDLRAWRWTTIPQLVVLFIAIIVLLTVAVFGLCFSIQAMRRGDSLKDLTRVVQVMITTSSSILGVVALKFVARLADAAKHYVIEERRFTSDVHLVLSAQTMPDLKACIRAYGRR